MANKTTYHHGDLRTALLEAALTILSHQDIEKLSLRGVAKQAGVSHTAPYRHFADKAALLAAVAEEGFTEFGQYLSKAVAEAEAEPIASLIATGEAYVRFALEHPTHFRIMFSHFPANPGPDSSLPVTAQGTFQILVEVIASGQAAGVIKPGDPEALAVSRWALVHGLAMLLLDGMLVNPIPANHPPNKANNKTPDKDACKPAMDLVHSTLINSLSGLTLED